jgi:hypothetical protein
MTPGKFLFKSDDPELQHITLSLEVGISSYRTYEAKVFKIIDGDTLQVLLTSLDVVETVRLLGIDAPETGIFDGQYLTPSEESGKRLFAWLNSGADPKGELLQQIEGLIRQLNLGEFQNACWLYTGNQYQAASLDQLDLPHLQEQLALLTQCRQNPSKLDHFQKLPAELVNQQSIASAGDSPGLAHGKSPSSSAMSPSPSGQSRRMKPVHSPQGGSLLFQPIFVFQKIGWNVIR